MYRRELTKYHSELAGILKSEPDRSQWKEFLAHERTTKEYKSAKKQAGLGNLIKPILPEVVGGLPIDDKTKQLVDILVTIIWVKEALNEYNGLPKGNSAQRRKARNLVTQTAKRLLESPQDISIAEKTWNTTQESEEPFSELVRKECQALIKEKWKNVAPGELAQLVTIYANDNCPSQDDARKILRNYFRGPNSPNQRIEAYYTFVSGVLDLAEEGKAFRKGMEIALHVTDILPKNPSLVEQTGILSLPYGELESVFKKLLIARSVVARVRFLGSWDLDKYYEDRGNFIILDSVSIEEGDKRKENVIKKIGESETREMYNRMKAAIGLIANGSIESLSEGVKQSLIKTWPFNLAFDETDDLNQKFQRVFSERKNSSTAQV